MADESKVVKWDSIEEPNPESYVRKAGIHQGCEVEEIVFNPPTEKDGETKNCYVTVKFEVPSETGISKFTDYIFEPQPASKIQYFDKLFVNGVAVRDLTPEEQHEKSWNEIMLYFLQLGMAAGVPFVNMKEKLTAWGKDLFEIATNMQKLLKDAPKNDFPKGKLVFDMKILWQNSKSKETSRLTIPKPRGRSSITFWSTPIINDGGTKRYGTSVIALSDYETKNGLSAKYSNNSNKPKDNETITSTADGGTDAAGEPLPEGDLF